MKRIYFLALMIVSTLSLLAKNETKIEQLQKQIANDSINMAQKDSVINVLTAQIANLQDSLLLFQFFNQRDISIFENYKQLEDKKLTQALTDKNKYIYETIKMIAGVEKELTTIENNIQKLQQQKDRRQWSDNDLKQYVKLEIKADLKEIGKKLDTIDGRDKSYFSNEQIGFYKKQSKRFDDIYNKYLF